MSDIQASGAPSPTFEASESRRGACQGELGGHQGASTRRSQLRRVPRREGRVPEAADGAIWCSHQTGVELGESGRVTQVGGYLRVWAPLRMHLCFLRDPYLLLPRAEGRGIEAVEGVGAAGDSTVREVTGVCAEGTKRSYALGGVLMVVHPGTQHYR